MGGCSIDDDQDSISALTLVLVGRTGNGKSATGNSIIGSKNFVSKRSSSGVTTTSKVATTTLADGRMLNVIDTPGLFDSSVDPKLTRKEIISCIDMAKDGIHAVLVVFSVCGRFSEEEKAVISSLVTFFGDKVYDYMIVVFTGGDELEDNGITLESFLSNSSETLKKILSSCGNRYVLFNNRKENQNKKAKQLQQLLYYVSMVLEKNGRALTNDIITEPKKGNMEQAKRVLALKEPEQYTKQEMLELKKQITKMCIVSSAMICVWVWFLSQFTQRGQTVILSFCGDSISWVSCGGIIAAVLVFFQRESRFVEISTRIEQKVEEERTARLKAEIYAIEERKKFKEMIYKLQEELKKTKEAVNHQCIIM